MPLRRETNPHFLPPRQPQDQLPHPQPRHGDPIIQLSPTRDHRRHQNRDGRPRTYPTSHSPAGRPPPLLQPGHSPANHQTQDHPHGHPEEHFPLHPQPRHGHHEAHFPLHQQPHHSTQPVRQQSSTQMVQQHRPPSNLRMPSPPKTKPHTWLIGAICALFWITVFLGGLAVLIVYLIFRPRSPKFDISSASFNLAYLDMGYLLNADMTLLANFTNPSKKATVDFSYMAVNLYYENTLIATTYVEPFSAMKAESNLRSVHLVSSQVRLPSNQIQHLRQQVNNNRVRFEVKGLLRTRSNLGSFLRYSYWLYGHCIIEVSGPPSGILLAKSCRTKR